MTKHPLRQSVIRLSHIPAEMRQGVEVHLCCNLLCRELAVHQKVLDFHHGELLNPVAWGATAYLRRNLMKMLGRNAKFLRIIGDGSVLPVGSAFEHLDEARHDVGCPLRGLFMREKSRMGIHRIEIKRPHTLEEGFRTIGFRRMLKAEESVLEVVLQKGKRLSLQMKDGVHEKMQPAACAVAAAGHTAHLLLGRQQQAVEPAIPRRLDASHMARHRYHQASRSERMLMPGEMKPTSASSTKEVQNLLLHDEVKVKG